MGSEWSERRDGSQLDDGAEAMREWRWRSYLDHVGDLGYDLRSGRPLEDELPGRLEAEDAADGGSPSSALR